MSLRRIRLVTQYSFPAFLRNGSGISYVFVTFILGIFLTEPLLMFYESKMVPLDDILELLQSSLSFALAAASLKGAFSEMGTLQEQGALEEFGKWAIYLLQERPALLSAVFAIELIAVPLFIASGAFNQLSGDLQHGAIRYQLLRVSRSELFIGRFFGMAIFTWILVSVVLLAVVLYMGMRLDLYEWDALLAWGWRGVFLFGVVSLPYVAFCSLVSANVQSPFGSLVLSCALVAGVPVVAFAAMEAWQPLGKLIYLMPWGIQHRLFHEDPTQVVLAVLGCLAYTAGYLVIGLWLFRRRDL